MKMHRRSQSSTSAVLLSCLAAGLLLSLANAAWAEEAAPPNDTLRARIESSVGKVRPSLVRIHVVETYYDEGREMKFEASGSGAVITPEGHIITNHHVAGHAKQLKCVFADKSELEAELVGTDPLTDIAVIKLKAERGRTFPVVSFGDSSQVQVGEQVLAMGCPLALSQSVTLGVISNTEMTMPQWMQRGGGPEQDGEDVGSLVRWIGHDAEIFPGNSGGPLVNLQGEIIGINEIKLGLSGAIPGNMAKEVALQLISKGVVRRAWLGLEVQPRLKHSRGDSGVLVGGVLKGSPAEEAGVRSGDLLLKVAGTGVDVRFPEQLPDFNRLVSGLAIGRSVELVLTRDGSEKRLRATPREREPYQPKQFELKQWGLTVRDLSFMIAKEMKRKSTEGVLVTSVRPGGPAGEAKPGLQKDDVIVSVGGKPVRSVRDLRTLTADLTKEASEPVPSLTGFERKTEQFVTVVKVGTSDLKDPGLEVRKAWLPVETQVITRDIAEALGPADLKGFRITSVYEGSTAAKAGLRPGDLILSVDGEKMTASAPEHNEELQALIRQYKVGNSVELGIRRGDKALNVPVELVIAPKITREMKKFRDDDFEFTVRDIAFFDKASEQWKEEQRGVLVDQVKPGGWAALGRLQPSDLIVEVDGKDIPDVEAMESAMTSLAKAQAKVVVFKILRGIHTLYIELEPKWESK